MHVNVSANAIAHPGLVARVNTALVEARLQPQHLTLELTENILMERLEAALPSLAQLREQNVFRNQVSGAWRMTVRIKRADASKPVELRDRKSTRLNSSHGKLSRMPSSA